MKSFLTLFLFCSLLTLGSAQQGFVVGANFMAVSSNIINQNTWGVGREYDYVATLKTSYGLDLGYNISDQFGIYTGYWFTNLGQDYEDAYDGSEWERSLALKYNMIPLMVKFNGNKSKVNFVGGAGILLASLKEAEQEWLRDGNVYSEELFNSIIDQDFNVGEEDVTERFSKSDILIHLEVGARVLFSDRLFMDLTLAMGYGLSDINDEDWRIPNNAGEYELSRNAFGGLKLGLAYVLFGGE